MTSYTITFDRIGRNHDPEPLTIEAKDADDLALKIFRKVGTRLASREVEILVDLAAGKATIYGGMRVAGEGQIVADGDPATGQSTAQGWSG